MKYLIFLNLLGALTFASCRSNDTAQAKEERREEKRREKVEDKVEDIADEVGDKLD